MRDKNWTRTYAKRISQLLPGDVIHHEAQTTSGPSMHRSKIKALDAAKMKRMRKLQKRAKQANG